MSTEAPDRSRGRPREFDEGAVLDAVMRLFNEQGFEASSLAEIVEAAGLNKSSLYNAFGSKEELFLRALRRYLDQREQMLAMATSGERGLDDVLAIIEFAESESMSEAGRRGCLALNTTAELGFTSQEMVKLSHGYRDMMRGHLRAPIARAGRLGEIDPDLVEVYVEAVMSFMLTAMLSARGGASDDELHRHFDAMRRLVLSWRVDSAT